MQIKSKLNSIIQHALESANLDGTGVSVVEATTLNLETINLMVL